MRKECRWREERWVEGVDSPIRKGRIMSAIHFVPVCLNSNNTNTQTVPSIFPFGKNPGANSPSDADVFKQTAGSASARNYRDLRHVLPK